MGFILILWRFFLMPSGLHNESVISDSINIWEVSATNSFGYTEFPNGTARLEIPHSSWQICSSVAGWSFSGFYLTISSWVFLWSASANISTHAHRSQLSTLTYRCVLSLIKLWQRETSANRKERITQTQEMLWELSVRCVRFQTFSFLISCEKKIYFTPKLLKQQGQVFFCYATKNWSLRINIRSEF